MAVISVLMSLLLDQLLPFTVLGAPLGPVLWELFFGISRSLEAILKRLVRLPCMGMVEIFSK
jgi:hypothetical protein